MQTLPSISSNYNHLNYLLAVLKNIKSIVPVAVNSTILIQWNICIIYMLEYMQLQLIIKIKFI